MLAVDSLSHSYGREQILNGVYLTVRPGEVVGVVGRNGCGKTTMLQALLGALRPDHMHLTIDGEIVRRAYRCGALAYLPQDPYLPRRIRVRTAIALALPTTEQRNRVREHPRIRPLLKRRIRDLSGGEQRFLEVLLACWFPSTCSLLDEPFTEIEPLHRRPVGALIRETAGSEQRGFIVTDHAYRDVLAVADRVLVLAGGVIRPAEGASDLRRWGYTP